MSVDMLAANTQCPTNVEPEQRFLIDYWPLERFRASLGAYNQLHHRSYDNKRGKEQLHLSASPVTAQEGLEKSSKASPQQSRTATTGTDPREDPKSRTPYS